jgi:hypothetical protein
MEHMKNDDTINMTFVFKYDREFDLCGWCPEKLPMFNAGSAMGVAHDILEHFPDTTDAPHDEFQALGAALHVRGDDYFSQTTPIDPKAWSNLASDVFYIFSKIYYGEAPALIAPKRAVKKLRSSMENIENDISMAIDRTRCDLINKWDEESVSQGEMQSRITWLDTHCEFARQWLRHGYLRARRRFRQLPSWRLCELFRVVETEVEACENKMFKHFGVNLYNARFLAENKDIRMHVSVDLARITARAQFLEASRG